MTTVTITPRIAADEKRSALAHGLHLLTRTSDDKLLTILRITMAIVMFPHGAQKLLGWFGGYGFTGTMGYFTETIGAPYILGVLAIITEFFGPFALLAGLGTRLVSVGIGSIMVVAVATTHHANGFFMNWSGTQAGEGFEYHILAFAISLVLFIGGSGKASLDRLISRQS